MSSDRTPWWLEVRELTLIALVVLLVAVLAVGAMWVDKVREPDTAHPLHLYVATSIVDNVKDQP